MDRGKGCRTGCTSSHLGLSASRLGTPPVLPARRGEIYARGGSSGNYWRRARVERRAGRRREPPDYAWCVWYPIILQRSLEEELMKRKGLLANEEDLEEIKVVRSGREANA